MILCFCEGSPRKPSQALETGPKEDLDSWLLGKAGNCSQDFIGGFEGDSGWFRVQGLGYIGLLGVPGSYLTRLRKL